MNSPLLGVTARRPKIWIPLTQNIDMVLGAQRAGTHVRNSNITRTNPDTDLIETLGNNIPVFENVGGLDALRDEPAGTNLIHFSHELGNVASGGWWGDVRLTSVTANGETGPDGTAAADGLVANVVNDSHYIQSPIITGVATDDKIVLTVFAKPGNKDWIETAIYFYDAGEVFLATGGYYFNLSSGVAGSPVAPASITVHNQMIEQTAHSCYRVGIIISCSNVNVAKIIGVIRSAHADLDNTFSGDTTTVNTWLWGADLKKQAYFDSYVPTSGATATRATESGYPLYTLPLGLFNAEGTCSVWVRFGYPFSITSAGAETAIVTVRDGILGLLSHPASGDGRWYTWDGANTGTVTVDWPANTWYKAVVQWSASAGKMRVGYDSGAGIVFGTEVTFDGSYTLGASLRLAYGLFGPMWVRDLRLWPEVLTDTLINAGGSP